MRCCRWRAGKHTLVEKPLALNAAQATELAELAAAQGVFFMEALWTMFLPKFDVIRQLLETGALGEIRTVHRRPWRALHGDHRILRHDLAGGPLLDLGTYPISFAAWILGEPATVLAAGQPHPAGVNGQVSAILVGAEGGQAVINTTVFSNTPTTGVIAGTAATLTIPGPYYQPGAMTLTSNTGQVLTYDEPQISHEATVFRGRGGGQVHHRRTGAVPAAAAGRLGRDPADRGRDSPAVGYRLQRGAVTPGRCLRSGDRKLYLEHRKPQREYRARRGRGLGPADQFSGYRPGRHDRVAPFVQADRLRQFLGAQAVRAAADRVHLQGCGCS